MCVPDPPNKNQVTLVSMHFKMYLLVLYKFDVRDFFEVLVRDDYMVTFYWTQVRYTWGPIYGSVSLKLKIQS